MKVTLLVFCGVAFCASAVAQMREPGAQNGAQASTLSHADVVPLPSIKSLTPAQAKGKKLFVQRCSVCHLPALPSYTAYGPLLGKNLVEDHGEEAERTQILQGSARMPGFQYTLTQAEVDQIVDYLKILELPKKD